MNWVVEIKFPTKTPIWVGTIHSESRADAKKMARRFVSAHFPSNVKILRIARGFMSLVLEAEPEPFDSDDE